MKPLVYFFMGMATFAIGLAVYYAGKAFHFDWELILAYIGGFSALCWVGAFINWWCRLLKEVFEEANEK